MSPEHINPSLIMRKTSDKPQLRDILYKLPGSNSEHRQGHQKQGKLEKLSQPIGAWGDMTTKCNVGSLGKKKKRAGRKNSKSK